MPQIDGKHWSSWYDFYNYHGFSLASAAVKRVHRLPPDFDTFVKARYQQGLKWSLLKPHEWELYRKAPISLIEAEVFGYVSGFQLRENRGDQHSPLTPTTATSLFKRLAVHLSPDEEKFVLLAYELGRRDYPHPEGAPVVQRWSERLQTWEGHFVESAALFDPNNPRGETPTTRASVERLRLNLNRLPAKANIIKTQPARLGKEIPPKPIDNVATWTIIIDQEQVYFEGEWEFFSQPFVWLDQTFEGWRWYWVGRYAKTGEVWDITTFVKTN
jgi:hypothetical protein